MSREEYMKEVETIKQFLSPEQKNMIEDAEKAYKIYDDTMEKLGYPNQIKNSENLCSSSEKGLF